MKVLVLGGTGAMGIPLVRILAQRKNRVFVTTRSKKESDNENIHYITGNAHNIKFLTKILEDNYDAVIDFMNYKPDEFNERYELFLKITKHYLFLSSARVYADSKKRITEDSPRLLDVTKDAEYIKTEEYALSKAREENLLINSQYKNWTIIRPYITYNDERLQLGVLEKEYWLQRALMGKTIVFGKDIAEKTTTLTHGFDVSLRIADLVGCPEAMGEIFHITTEQNVTWRTVLDNYVDVLEEVIGKRPRVCMVENSNMVADLLNNYHQIRYDRLYNRTFDNSKIQSVTKEETEYKETREGLEECLRAFLCGNRQFKFVNWRLEASFDRLTGDKTSLKDISGFKQKVKYFVYRYL